MAKAFLHREQHARIAACLDVYHPIGMQPGEMQRRGEQVAPAQAPEHRPLDPREDAGEEDRGAGVVGQVGTAGDFMQRAGRETAAGQMTVERLDPERDGRAPCSRPLDLGNAGAQFGKDVGVAHGIEQTRQRLIRSLSVPTGPEESSDPGSRPSSSLSAC